jgi:hypothetical protein
MNHLAAWAARSRRIARIAAVSAIGLSVHSAAADVVVSYEDQPDSPTFVQISGTITRTDISVVAAALGHEKTSIPEVIVSLDSDGGDVDAAMDIGRLLRKKASVAGTTDRMAIVFGRRSGVSFNGLSGALCASACVLVMCGGAERLGGLRVGIHRPYSVRLGPKSDGTGSAAYAAMTQRLKDYLEEMGMPARLFDEMMQVPAQSVRWLSEREQEAFGLGGKYAAAADSGRAQMVASVSRNPRP